MTTPLTRHVRAPELIGSWPFVPPTTIGGTPHLQPGTVNRAATVLGVVQEPAAGFFVVGQQFRIYIDANPVAVVGSFADPGPGYLTLDDVVSQINALPITVIASRDNGFLRLTSSVDGDTSYLRLETDNTSPDTLQTLGLFPEVESRAGEITPAAHPDPVRQRSLPGQLSLAAGEPFSAEALNRSLFQLAINSDRTEGLMSEKRIAVQKEVAVGSYASPATGEGYQFAGGEFPFTGLRGATSPSVTDLEKNFVVLDSNDRELVKEMQAVIASIAVVTFTVEPETGQQLVTATTTPFASAHEKGDYYLTGSDGFLGPLANVPLKIYEVLSTSKIVLQTTQASDGTPLVLAGGPIAMDLIQITTAKCVVEEVRTVHNGSRVEGLLTQKLAPTAPARVEKNNRVVFSGAGLAGLGFPLSVGDRVEWTGHLETVPFSNNGEYRVSQVIDDETIELIGLEGEPVYLNPTLTAGAGTLEVTTDGEFYEQPFLKFLDSPTGGIPDVGEAFKILYLDRSNLRDALADPTALLAADGLRYAQEADDSIHRAIKAVVGHSFDNLDDYLYSDRRQTLQDLIFRERQEHYTIDQTDPDYPAGDVHAGRHKDIRPDTIDMFPSHPGETVIVRADPTDSNIVVKISLRDQVGDRVFEVTADGRLAIRRSGNLTGTFTQISENTINILANDADVEMNVVSQGVGNDATIAVASFNADANLDVTSFSAAATIQQTAVLAATITSSSSTDDSIIEAVAAGNSFLRSTSTGAANKAWLEVDALTGASQALMRLRGASNESSGSIGSEIGSSILQFIGDHNGAQSEAFVMSLRPGGGFGPHFYLDWVNDGTGAAQRGLGFRGDGAAAFGGTPSTAPLTIYETVPANIFVSGTAFSPNQYIATSTSNKTGVLVRTANTNIDGTSPNGAFVSTFDFDDGATNDDRRWKAFKSMSESPLIDRFAVDKYGTVYCGLNAANQADDLADNLNDAHMLSHMALWARKNVLVGNLHNWDGFTDTAGGFYPGTQIWMAGGEGLPGAPYGMLQGVWFDVREAQVFNCWFDNGGGPTNGWRYVTDADYATRVWNRGAPPGASAWGYTQWSAAAPNTGGAAGDVISTVLGDAGWVHGLIWDHETGYFAIGRSTSALPTEMLQLRQSDGGNAWIRIDQDNVGNVDSGFHSINDGTGQNRLWLQGNSTGAVGVYIHTTSTTPDPFISFLASSAAIKIGIDNSIDDFRIQPAISQTTGFSGTTGFNMDVSNGRMGLNLSPSDSYDVRIGLSAPSVASLYTAGNIVSDGHIATAGTGERFRAGSASGYQFGSAAATARANYWCYISPQSARPADTGTPTTTPGVSNQITYETINGREGSVYFFSHAGTNDWVMLNALPVSPRDDIDGGIPQVRIEQIQWYGMVHFPAVGAYNTAVRLEPSRRNWNDGSNPADWTVFGGATGAFIDYTNPGMFTNTFYNVILTPGHTLIAGQYYFLQQQIVRHDNNSVNEGNASYLSGGVIWRNYGLRMQMSTSTLSLGAHV